MITFIIGLFIGATMGLIFTSILVMSRDDAEVPEERKIPVRVRVRGSALQEAFRR